MQSSRSSSGRRHFGTRRTGRRGRENGQGRVVKPTYCDAPDAPPPTGGYSQAAVVEGARRTVHISGQIPADAEGRTPAGFDAQCRLAWRNVERQLVACGMNFDNLVKVTTYLSDRRWG